MSSPVLPPNAPIALELDVATEDDAIKAVMALLRDRSDIVDFEAFQSDVFERQKINAPLLGSGIAMPHARTSQVKEVVFAVGRCKAPVPFGEDGAPVSLIFLYGIPPHRVSEHLATTAALARRLRDPAVVMALMDAKDTREFVQPLT